MGWMNPLPSFIGPALDTLIPYLRKLLTAFLQPLIFKGRGEEADSEEEEESKTEHNATNPAF